MNDSKTPSNLSRKLRWLLRLLAPCSFLLAPCLSHAQWQTTAYTLKGGWNSIYLSGDAKQQPLADLFPAAVLEVWRWVPNPEQAGFMESPLIPAPGTPEWKTWKRDGSVTTLTPELMTGQAAYLVFCSGVAADTYALSLKQSPKIPGGRWVRNGANLLGFPTFKNGANYPLFSAYFTTFPAAIAANTKVFKYVGGPLGASNPLQVFSPTTERVDRTQAYWFSAEVVGDYVSPIEISLSSSDGLAFGKTGSLITMYVKNRTAAPVTLTLTPTAGEAAPAGQTIVAAAVPLRRRTFNTTTLQPEETPITAAFTEVIAPQTTVELLFGINRGDPSMSGAATDASFASFLRVTDSGNLMDVFLPATAQKSSQSGLWVGDITLTNVSNKVSNKARATAAASLTTGTVTSVAVVAGTTGGFGYTSAPGVTIAPPPAGGVTATATATVANGSVTGFTITNPGSGYAIASPKVEIDPPPPQTGSSVPTPFPMRTLLHVSDTGAAKLLSQVFLGKLAPPTNGYGLCAVESLLKQDEKSSAQRLVAAHMPLTLPVAGTGSVAGSLEFTVQIPYNDPTNPFLHRYHPDHDNKSPRFELLNPLNGKTATTALLSDGVEAPAITRVCTFTFTDEPPSGSSVTSGWGSAVIGGTYSEAITGIHKEALTLSGIFELRRASEIGVLKE
jgi:hypothetical protein